MYRRYKASIPGTKTTNIFRNVPITDTLIEAFAYCDHSASIEEPKSFPRRNKMLLDQMNLKTEEKREKKSTYSVQVPVNHNKKSDQDTTAHIPKREMKHLSPVQRPRVKF